MQENEKKNIENLENQQPTSPLKEQGGVMMEGHIRIFDPETGEDMVNKRS